MQDNQHDTHEFRQQNGEKLVSKDIDLNWLKLEVDINVLMYNEEVRDVQTVIDKVIYKRAAKTKRNHTYT
jgi:hypothetical protein